MITKKSKWGIINKMYLGRRDLQTYGIEFESIMEIASMIGDVESILVVCAYLGTDFLKSYDGPGVTHFEVFVHRAIENGHPHSIFLVCSIFHQYSQT